MGKITQRDIVESISGLRGVATDLRQGAASPPIGGAPLGTVLLDGTGLLRHAAYLETVADELLTLIPEKKVTVPE